LKRSCNHSLSRWRLEQRVTVLTYVQAIRRQILNTTVLVDSLLLASADLLSLSGGVTCCTMRQLCNRLVIATLNCLQMFITSIGATSCYSCMSYIYGANWEYLDYKELYLRPSAFSDRCANGSDSKYIGKTPCLHNCILIIEKMRVGARGHNGYIRGCYDQIFRHGFNDSNLIASKLKYRDFCTRTMMSSLIARRDKPPDTEVLVCSCRDTLCNGSTWSKSFKAGSLLFILITLSAVQHVIDL
ncbi:hypothetical protein M514_08221, partial [Trichuris suis]